MKKGEKDYRIVVSKNGPYLVFGDVPMNKETSLCDKENIPIKWKKGEKFSHGGHCALCRCGKSKNKPFCDGTHSKIKFNGKEIGNEKYSEMAGEISGKELILYDAQKLCSSARFCHRAGGIWNLVANPENSESKKIAIQEACNCPSGRLVLYDKKTKKIIEPQFEKSIGITEDSRMKVSGPIWVKGKIPIESYSGKKYELRNRVTLCRCGKSKNKPFCDGTHIKIGFNSEEK